MQVMSILVIKYTNTLVYLYSDGVSRSGTFCALMVCINRFRTEKIVDVFRTIQIMRGQRPGIVGNVVRPLYIVCVAK